MLRGAEKGTMREKIYRIIFWLGIVSVIAVAIVPLKVNLYKTTLTVGSFKFHLDQILHVGAYSLICIYFFAGQYYGLTLFKGNSIYKFLVVILFLAIITELIQLVIPYRTFNFFDLIANAVGIFLGILVMKVFSKQKFTISPPPSLH